MQTVDLNAPLPTGTTGDARSAPLKALAGGGSRYIADTAAASPTETPRKPSPIKAIKEIVDRETGEVLQFSRQRDGSLVVEKTPSQVLFLKWMRKAALAEIFGLKHRVSCCHRNPIKQATSVQVWAKLNAFIPGHFVGLQTCALPWLCPICSPKIAQRRSKEIQQAMDKCLANGGQVLMPTFTIPHGRQDPLAETLDLIKKALRWMSSHRQYKQLQGRLGVQGRIIATEMNHGEANGWHPHFHELWFFEGNGVDASKLEAELYVLWKAACAKFGLGEPSRQHGVDVQDGSLAAAYVAKMGDKPWTLADEMAKSISKKGRRSNLSFWELIDCYLDESVTTKRRNRAKQLIIEYAEATKGIKVLTWTRELKALYDVTERTDAEVAAQQEEEAVFIADISLDDWRIVARHRLQHLILGVCLQGRAAIYAVIDAYRNKSPKPLIRSITDSTSSHKSGGDPAEGGCQPCGVEASTEQPVSPGESGLVPADRRAPNYTFEDGYGGRRSTNMKLTTRKSDTVSIFSNGDQIDDSPSSGAPVRALRALRLESSLPNAAEGNPRALGYVIRPITESASLRKPDGAPLAGCQPCDVEARVVGQLQHHVATSETGPAPSMSAIEQSLIAWVEYRNSYQKGGTHEEAANRVPAPRKVRTGRNRPDPDLHQDSRGGEGHGGQLGLQNLVSYAAIRE